MPRKKSTAAKQREEARQTQPEYETKESDETPFDLLGDDAEEDLQLTVNKSYAAKYKERKKAEELSKLKEKYGSDYEESSDEDEDMNGDLVTPEVELQVLKTISAIRAHDPSIYDKEKAFFNDEIFDSAAKSATEKSKPLHLKDFHRENLLSGKYTNDGDGLDHAEEEPVMTHVEEQETLKRAFKEAANVAPAEEDEFLVERVKSEQEREEEESQYRKFLLENLSSDKNATQVMSSWMDFKKENPVNDEESFLMSYVLNRGWVDKEADRVPSYKEMMDEEEEDEKAVEAMEEFENKYNFRFEEAGGTQIQTYSRKIEDSLRRPDDRRKLKRQADEERKKLEKKQKLEELKRLKNLKKKELLKKLKQIQAITGNKSVGLEDVDLSGDFDPEKYDEKMNSLFNEQYYEAEDAAVKPVFEEDIDISDIVPEASKKEAKRKKPVAVPTGDDDFIMDADYLPGGQYYEEESNSKKKKKSKRQEEDAILEEAAKKDQDLNRYLEETYQLEYEDMIGDLPTRFKYTKVTPCSYGLSPVDILMADDALLNEHVSLKKLAPFRPEDRQKQEMKRYSKKYRVHQFYEKQRQEWEKQRLQAKQSSQMNENEQVTLKGKQGEITVSKDRLASYMPKHK